MQNIKMQYNMQFLENTLKATEEKKCKYLRFPILDVNNPIELEFDIFDLDDLESLYPNQILGFERDVFYATGNCPTDLNFYLSNLSVDKGETTDIYITRNNSENNIRVDSFKIDPSKELKMFISRALLLGKIKKLVLEINLYDLEKLLNLNYSVKMYEPLLAVLFSKINKNGFFLFLLCKAGKIKSTTTWGYRGHVNRGNSIFATNIKLSFYSYTLGKVDIKSGLFNQKTQLEDCFNSSIWSFRMLDAFLPNTTSVKYKGLHNHNSLIRWISSHQLELTTKFKILANSTNKLGLYCLYWISQYNCFVPLALPVCDPVLFSFELLLKELSLKRK